MTASVEVMLTSSVCLVDVVIMAHIGIKAGSEDDYYGTSPLSQSARTIGTPNNASRISYLLLKFPIPLIIRFIRQILLIL